MKRAFFMFMVFLAGGVVFINLVVLKFGEPSHYDASWEKVVFITLLALYFGYAAIKRS